MPQRHSITSSPSLAARRLRAERSPIRYAQLEPGDVLVVIADGFMEQHSSSDEQFGSLRLLGTIRRHTAEPALGLIDALHADVRSFAGTAAQDDDTTVVRGKRMQGPARGGAGPGGGRSASRPGGGKKKRPRQGLP